MQIMRVGIGCKTLVISTVFLLASVVSLGQAKKGEKMGWTAYHGTVMTEARQVDIDLERAVEKNDIEAVKKLLAAGGDPNYKVRPPLLEVRGTSKQIIAMSTLLIDRGANVNVVDYYHRNAILYVMDVINRWGSPEPYELVQFFLSKGVKPDTPDASGDIALHVATRYGWEKCVKALLENHADVNARSNVDKLKYADRETRQIYNKYFEPGYVERGITPLQELMRANYMPTIALILISAGADVKAVDDNGWTTLHYAAWGQSFAGVQFCLDHGVSVDAVSKFGSTPLMLCALNGLPSADPKVVSLLVNNGADAHRKMRDGSTILAAFQRKAKSELKHIVEDPNYLEDEKPKEVLAKYNKIVAMLDPAGKPMTLPALPVKADGIHYAPLEWDDVSVSRVVRVEKKCISLTLGFRVQPTSQLKRIEVLVAKLRLGNVTPQNWKDLKFKISKGQTKKIRVEFPKSVGVDKAMHAQYGLHYANGSASGTF